MPQSQVTPGAGTRSRLGPPSAPPKRLVRAHIRNGAGDHIYFRDIIFTTQTDQPQYLVVDEQGNAVPPIENGDQILTSIYRLVFYRENYQPQSLWAPRRKYSAGDSIVDLLGHIQRVQKGGTSGQKEPKWNQSGGPTVDGSVRWVDQGLSPLRPPLALLVLDTHRGSIRVPADRKSCNVQATFLQLLDSPTRHGISANLKITPGGTSKPVPYYERFRVGARLDDSLRDGQMRPDPYSVDLLDGGDNKPGGLDRIIAGGVNRSYGRSVDDSSPLAPREALHFKPPANHKDGALVRVSLQSLSKTAPDGSTLFYVFAFKVKLNRDDFELDSSRWLQTFGFDPKDDSKVPPPKKELFELGRILIQRPDLELVSDQPMIDDQSTHSQWLLHIFGIHSEIALTEWDARLQDYHRSLNLGRGGQPVSFFPAVDRNKAQGHWVMTWRAIDFAAADYHRDVPLRFVASDESKQPDESLPVILPQSLCFWRSTEERKDLVTFSAVFPQIETHTGQKLGCDLRVRRPFPDTGDDPSPANLKDAGILNLISGVAMSFGQPITALTAAGGSPALPPQHVRMGSLDLEFAQNDPNPDPDSLYWMGLARTPPPGPRGIPGFFQPNGTVPASLRDESSTPDGVRAFCDVVFSISDLLPGGQDDPAGEEFVPDRLNDRMAFIGDRIPPRFLIPNERDEMNIESHFHRARPLIIPPRPPAAAPAGNYYLRVREDLVPFSSQALRLNIISRQTKDDSGAGSDGSAPCAPEAQNRHTIILDRDPFLVAQVRYPDFTSGTSDSSVIAEWASTDSAGASWHLRFDQKPFCLALPPQAIGDEMVKGKESDDPATHDPAIAPPTGFNFSPPALLTVDPRAAATNFSEAPWNLRRILGTPGQPGAGPGVLAMQVELLYGLSCDIDKPAVRLAEIFSRVGKIAGRRDPFMAWAGTNVQSAAYLDSRKQWAVLYRRYLSRIAVLEPWNNLLPTDTDIAPELNQSVSCHFRLPPFSNLADPTKVPTDKPQPTTSLRGGVTWPFESPNIYNAVVHPAPDAQQHSSSAELANIALSSEGGWGHVATGFQNDLTRIIADVSMGRVVRYQLERLGRIGVFWNLAKHVIVYERVVAPSRQFQGDQDGFYGWPIARKVEEYIQILEETRSYPDITITGATDSAEMRRARGFVAHCAFEKENRFNVKSSWGSDVNNEGVDRGWRVPLWQPGAVPSDIYPKRQPHLGVVGQVAGKTAIIPADIAEPQNVYFYTQTWVAGPTSTPNGDPHNWNPVLGVDYVNAPLPAPAPSPEFDQGERRTFSADETHTPPGYGPCTFRLDRPSSPSDIMTERFGQPMSAFLDSVTMVRSVAKGVSADWNTVADVENKVHLLYSTVLSKIPLDSQATASAKAEILNLLKAGNTTFSQLNGAISAAQAVVGRVQKIDVKAFEKQLLDSALARLNAALQAPLDQLRDDVNQFAGDSVDDAVAILQRVRNTVSQQLLMVESLPGAAKEAVARYADRVASLYTEVDNEISAITLLVQAGAANLTKAFDRANALLLLVQNLQDALDSLGRQMPAPWMPNPVAAVTSRLDPYFQQLIAAFTPLLAALRIDTQTALTALQTFRTTFGTVMQPNNLQAFLQSALGSTPAGGTILVIVAALRGNSWNIETVLAQWNAAVDAAIVKVRAAPSQLKVVLSAQRDDLINQLGVNGFVQKLIQGLVPDDTTVAALNGFLGAATSGVASILSGAEAQLNGILNDASVTLDSLKSSLEKQRDNLTNAARTYLDHAAAGLAASGVAQAADAGLRLVRAFGDPPRVPQLDFERSKIGYYFNQLAPHVDLSPVVSVVNQGAAVLDALKPLGLKLPTTQALDQLIPPDLKHFDLSKIFPNFAGLDLSHLFSGLRLPDSISKDNVKVTHGLDAQTRRAFVQTDINFQLTDPATIFATGPLVLTLPKGGFKASTLIAADPSGVTRKASGELAGDWQLCIGGMVLLVLEKTKLTFDDSGGLHFNVDPHNIKMPGILEFITNLLQQFTPKGSGLSIGLLPDGFQSVLKLPLPDLSFGAFGITNLSLGAFFAIRYSGDFKLSLGANLARRDAPFSLTVFILGGGGFFETNADYTPSNGKITCQAAIGITVSASLAIALGPIKGGIYAYLGITASYSSDQDGLTMGILFMLHGEVSVLSIVSASITLLLEANYGNGALIGHGRLTISIKICWCFTLEVNEEVTWQLAGGSSSQRAQVLTAPNPVYLAMNEARPDAAFASDANGPMAAAFSQALAGHPADDDYRRAARLYVSSLI